VNLKPKRALPRILPRQGSVVHREVVEKVPMGSEGVFKRSKRTEIVQRPELSYGDLLAGICELLDRARRMSVRSINSILTAAL